MPRKRKQPFLEGMEPPSFRDIEEAAAKYVEARDERMARLKDETAAGAELLRLMHQHKLTAYDFDGQVVYINTLERVKVKSANSEEESEE